MLAELSSERSAEDWRDESMQRISVSSQLMHTRTPQHTGEREVSTQSHLLTRKLFCNWYLLEGGKPVFFSGVTEHRAGLILRRRCQHKTGSLWGFWLLLCLRKGGFVCDFFVCFLFSLFKRKKEQEVGWVRISIKNITKTYYTNIF